MRTAVAKSMFGKQEIGLTNRNGRHFGEFIKKKKKKKKKKISEIPPDFPLHTRN